MVEHPKVFISYSHDSDTHKNWVLKLATDLRQHFGVDVILDQWDLRVGGDLSLFMEQGLSESSLVICICSDEYVRKANAGIGGSGYEKMILTQSLLKNTNIDYILPVVRCNKNNIMPTFLGTKLYVNFSNDEEYLNKMSELLARIYNEDISLKPPLGESPYSKKNANSITIKTDIEKAQYHNPLMDGTVSFDFKSNSGDFTIGSGEYEFITHWSECDGNTIYAYRDRAKLIGYCAGKNSIPENSDFSEYDFTSRTREISVGEVVVYMNHNNKFVAILVTNVAVRTRGKGTNNLSFTYKIYP